MQTLIELGFEIAGEWQLSETVLTCSLTQHATESSILYAFVSAEQVLYIGKSVRTLSQRMYQYQRPGPTQRTNIRNHANIKQILKKSESVRIYAFVPQEQLHYRSIPVSLAAGLEDILISRIKPVWNFR